MSEIKVAFVEPIGGHRGNEFYDFGLCKALNDQGVEITFYTCDKTHLDEKFKFNFKTVKSFHRVFGKDFILLRGWRFFKAGLRTLKHARANGSRIVHLHIYHFSWLDFYLLWLFKRRNFKVVTTIHDVEDFKKYGEKINAGKYRKFQKRIDRVIVHSDFAKESVEKYFAGFPKDHIHKCPHGDSDFLFRAEGTKEDARIKLNLPKRKQIILFFGQVKKVKGLDVLLKAFSEMRKLNPNAMLLVAGPPFKVEEKMFFDMIHELRIEHDCMMRLEYIADELVPEYFRAADIVVLPYRKIYSSGVLIRSLDYGAAIVASDLDVFKAVVHDGANGILFQTENAHDLSEKMLHLLADVSLQESLKHEAKKTADEKFGWKLIGEKVKEVYELALK